MSVAKLALKTTFVCATVAGGMAIYGDYTGQSGAEVGVGLWEMIPGTS